MEAATQGRELLEWYASVGVDEAMGDVPVDRTIVVPKNLETPTPFSRPTHALHAGHAESRDPVGVQTPGVPAFAGTTTPVGAVEAMGDAQKLARAANTLEELRAAIESFEGLPIKRGATHMVFADGNPEARIMFVGEAPGADEDRIGKPFVGVSGQLLDRKLASIGLARESNAYISNIINWRPPGNRNPSDSEVALSLPFIRRHIELINPAVLICVGGVSAKALLDTPTGITRLRGKWIDYTSEGLKQPVPTLAMFHPAYLLRSPAQKGLAWADLLKLQAKMKELGVL